MPGIALFLILWTRIWTRTRKNAVFKRFLAFLNSMRIHANDIIFTSCLITTTIYHILEILYIFLLTYRKITFILRDMGE